MRISDWSSDVCSSDLRKGFPSETQVKKGRRVVHGHKELTEKLGRNDPCPCGSRRLFQRLLPRQGQVLMASTVMTTIAENIRATLSWGVALLVACSPSGLHWLTFFFRARLGFAAGSSEVSAW